MIRSMTGYGRGECILHNRRIVAEIKSVNHRYNDITIKMPKLLNPLEDSIRKKLSQEINRGKTDIYISMETFSTDDIKISFNEATADLYVDELKKIVKRYGILDGINLDIIARFPDLITVDKNMDEEKIKGEIDESLKTALEIALDAFIKMREAEGEALKKDIHAKTAEVKEMVEKIKERAPHVADEYAERLKTRISEVLANADVQDIDEQRLLTEIAIFADKSCIDEEITRLFSHVTQLEQILGDGNSVGRKLDFLMQEMNREVNTIGSKSNDLPITKIVIDLKSELEKIREQIQNIE